MSDDTDTQHEVDAGGDYNVTVAELGRVARACGYIIGTELLNKGIISNDLLGNVTFVSTALITWGLCYLFGHLSHRKALKATPPKKV